MLTMVINIHEIRHKRFRVGEFWLIAKQGHVVGKQQVDVLVKQ